MNKNLEKVLERIVEEEELTKEFSKYNDMDEMYEYCTELGGGYTEEEFDEGIAEAINALRRQGRETALSDEDMGYVAGGINLNGMLSKTAAVMLAALTAGSIGMPFGAKAAEIPQNTVGTQAVSVIKAEDSSKWSKTKEALSNFWKEHKKKIIIGTTVLTALVISGVAVLAYNHRTEKLREQAEAEKKEAARPAAKKESQKQQEATQLEEKRKAGESFVEEERRGDLEGNELKALEYQEAAALRRVNEEERPQIAATSADKSRKMMELRAMVGIAGRRAQTAVASGDQDEAASKAVAEHKRLTELLQRAEYKEAVPQKAKEASALPVEYDEEAEAEAFLEDSSLFPVYTAEEATTPPAEYVEEEVFPVHTVQPEEVLMPTDEYAEEFLPEETVTAEDPSLFPVHVVQGAEEQAEEVPMPADEYAEEAETFLEDPSLFPVYTVQGVEEQAEGSSHKVEQAAEDILLSEKDEAAQRLQEQKAAEEMRLVAEALAERSRGSDQGESKPLTPSGDEEGRRAAEARLAKAAQIKREEAEKARVESEAKKARAAAEAEKIEKGRLAAEERIKKEKEKQRLQQVREETARLEAEQKKATDAVKAQQAQKKAAERASKASPLKSTQQIREEELAQLKQRTKAANQVAEKARKDLAARQTVAPSKTMLLGQASVAESAKTRQTGAVSSALSQVSRQKSAESAEKTPDKVLSDTERRAKVRKETAEKKRVKSKHVPGSFYGDEHSSASRNVGSTELFTKFNYDSWD